MEAPFDHKIEKQLDETGQNILVVRVRADEAFVSIISFAIIQLHYTNGEAGEVIKIDGGQGERIHIHNYFLGPDEKEYHSRPISFDTIIHYYDRVLENWRWYLAQYQNNYI